MLSSWSGGYVTDIDYTYGFYRELTPELIRLAALSRNVDAPQGALKYLELGCGHGLSANIIAAANPSCEVTAIDFNPAHITSATRLAREAGLGNIRFREQSFEELCNSADGETYDIIAMHGIYSWVSDENRRYIRKIVRQRLRTGGLLYMSYNALPGWASAMPLRRIIADGGRLAGGRVLDRLDAGIRLTERLKASGARYFRFDTSLGPRLDTLKKQNRNYLAHEYLNGEWVPFYSGDVHEEMSDQSKVNFIASMHLIDHVDTINLTEEQVALLGEVSDGGTRETLRDFMVNQQFRRDLLARGTPGLTPPEAWRKWLDQRFALVQSAASIPRTLATGKGEATLVPEVYDPLLAALDGGPRTVRELLAGREGDVVARGRITQGLLVLVGAGYAGPALPKQGEAERARRCNAFNEAVMARAADSADVLFLASPVLGGGVAVGRLEQLFLAADRAKKLSPVAFTWKILSERGQRLMKDGVTCESEADNIAHLEELVANFEKDRRPVLARLGIQ